jgi:hypothetical protein
VSGRVYGYTVVMVTVATALRPVIVIAVMVPPALKPVIIVVIFALARSCDLAGMLVALSAHDLPRGGVDLHIGPRVQHDTVGQHAVLAIEVDLGDVCSPLPL